MWRQSRSFQVSPLASRARCRRAKRSSSTMPPWRKPSCTRWGLPMTHFARGGCGGTASLRSSGANAAVGAQSPAFAPPARVPWCSGPSASAHRREGLARLRAPRRRRLPAATCAVDRAPAARGLAARARQRGRRSGFISISRSGSAPTVRRPERSELHLPAPRSARRPTCSIPKASAGARRLQPGRAAQSRLRVAAPRAGAAMRYAGRSGRSRTA